jgi:CHAD domain-containing protein
MNYTLSADETVSVGVRRVIAETVTDALNHLDGDMDQHETVHEVRKRCKETRATLRLVRGVLPTYSEENGHYRDTARLLSDVRDAEALVETFDDHVRPTALDAGVVDEDRLEEVRAKLVDRRDRTAAEQHLDERFEEVRQRLLEGRARVDGLPVATEGFDAVSAGLRKSYRRGRDRMAEAYEDPTTEAFHEWRKRLKYHRYHTSLLRFCWPGPMEARRAELKRLSDLTGDEHDLGVFLATMWDEQLFDERTRTRLDRAVTTRRAELRRESRPLGERVFAEAPDDHVDRMRAYWVATREYDADGDDA